MWNRFSDAREFENDSRTEEGPNEEKRVESGRTGLDREKRVVRQIAKSALRLRRRAAVYASAEPNSVSDAGSGVGVRTT